MHLLQQVRSKVGDVFGGLYDYSEDCLYLNIWTLSLPSKSETKFKPVFVWIFGGAFSVGGISMAMNHGYTLSSTQDIVVVCINYRVGPHGFLVSPDVSNSSSSDSMAPGNAGL